MNSNWKTWERLNIKARSIEDKLGLLYSFAWRPCHLYITHSFIFTNTHTKKMARELEVYEYEYVSELRANSSMYLNKE